jgi:hypothetical protein
LSAESETRRDDKYLGAHVGRHTVLAFVREAKKRKMPLSRLIAKTLQCVAAGKLFEAVLDTEDA